MLAFIVKQLTTWLSRDQVLPKLGFSRAASIKHKCCTSWDPKKMDCPEYLIDEVCKGLSPQHAGLVRAVIQENADVREDLQNVTGKLNKATEGFEQERYVLKKRLEMMNNMEQHYTEEVNSLQSQLDALKSKSGDQKTQEAESSTKLKAKIEELTSALEVSQKSEKVVLEKFLKMESVFADYKEEQEGVTDQKSLMMSDDYLQLQSQLTELQETVEDMQDKLTESEDIIKKLSLEKQALLSLVLEKGEELEQIRAELSSYTNTLEKVREENLEYQVQMENMKLEKASHGEKGNSLFGELDDRRLMAEKNLVHIQAQYETAKQQLTREKQHHHRLKVQMTTLLQANTENVSSERLTRMESLISQLRTEKANLLRKIRDQESAQKEVMSKFMEAQKDSDGKQDYTQFLTSVIESKEGEISKLQQEIHQHNFKMLSKDDTVIECNRKIFKLESELDRAKRQVGKLNVQLEEIKMKYEPEKENAGIKIGKTEKIPLTSETVNESEKFVLRESILPNSMPSQTHSETINDTSGISFDCASLYSTAVDDNSAAESMFRSGKQVKIQESLEMISEDGNKEQGNVREQNGKDKENFKAIKKGPRGIVHHNVKKVPSTHTNNFDKSQCKQQ